MYSDYYREPLIGCGSRLLRFLSLVCMSLSVSLYGSVVNDTGRFRPEGEYADGTLAPSLIVFLMCEEWEVA